jgi:predicted nucleic acid-binding protein
MIPGMEGGRGGPPDKPIIDPSQGPSWDRAQDLFRGRNPPSGTSTWIAFLEGTAGQDSQLLGRALGDRQVVMIPVVLTELLSDPALSSGVAETLSEIPMIELEPGYWQRAGLLRSKVLSMRKARLGDALIAQNCIDRGIALLTRDNDFRAFSDAAQLNLVP